MTGRAPALALTLALGACASTSPEPAFRDVAKDVEARLGQRVHWRQGTKEDLEVDRAVRALLAKDLTVDGAVQIALVRNRALVATYEELRIAQADVVQAGLLKNPVFSAQITAAERDALDPNLVFGVTQDFLDVLLLPAKKTIAESQLAQVKLRVSEAVLDLAADVRAAFYALQAARDVAEMRRVVAESARASSDVAERQTEAGNMSDLSLANERGQAAQLEIDRARADLEVRAAHERLTRLLGLWGADTRFTVPAKLPDLPADDPPLEHLESLAVAQRLDLAAQEREVQTLAYTLDLVKQGRFTGAIGVGADVARLKNGTIAVGPRADVELPLFDQRQAQIARVEGMLRAGEERLAARATDIRSEVRSARDRVVFARRVVRRYKDDLVPLRERIVRLSQEQYDAMLIGVYQLLLAKQAEVNAYREYIEAVRDYWLARTDLERAIGGRWRKP